MNPFQKGTVIDLTFKSVLKDLMNQFWMKPGVDYVDNLKDNEPATDFVALSRNCLIKTCFLSTFSEIAPRPSCV